MAAKKRTTVRSQKAKNVARMKKFSDKDQAAVRRKAHQPYTLPVTGAVLPHSKTKATAAAIRRVAGKLGDYQERPRGPIKNRGKATIVGSKKKK